MNIDFKQLGREFIVGRSNVKMRDCGAIALRPEEQVTFVTEAGGEYDVARKSWGFYATPSLNSRLKNFKLRPAVIKNLENRFFVVLVEEGKENEFDRYVKDESLTVVAWLDSDQTLKTLFD